MKTLRTIVLLLTCVGGALLLPFAPLAAKPPTAKSTPKPAVAPTPPPTADGEDDHPLASWLLEQDGFTHAIALPLFQVVAPSGNRLYAFDRANPEDAAFLTTFGTIMDRVLPRINRPDSSVHAAAQTQPLDEVVARIEDEVVNLSRDTPGFLSSDGLSAKSPGRGYPGLRLDTAKGKVYYLGVTLYPTGKRDEATRSVTNVRAFRFDPTEHFLDTSGGCLLVGIEYNGKIGGDTAFLNWDVVDVAKVPVRASISFEASGSDVYSPGAVLTDGRKGSD